MWKSVISNTPRTLVEIMGELVSQSVTKLASSSGSDQDNEVDGLDGYDDEDSAADMRLVAGKALGDVVRKLVRINLVSFF